MDTNDVRDLPEPLARAIQAMVETMQDQLRDQEQRRRRKFSLPVMSGKTPFARLGQVR